MDRKLQVETTGLSEASEEERLSEDACSELERVVQELSQQPERLRQILQGEEFQHLWRRLPPEVQAGEEAQELFHPASLLAILEQAKALLLEELAPKEER